MHDVLSGSGAETASTDELSLDPQIAARITRFDYLQGSGEASRALMPLDGITDVQFSSN